MPINSETVFVPNTLWEGFRVFFVRDYGNPMGKCAENPRKEIIAPPEKLITVMTMSGVSFKGILISRGQDHITLVSGVDIERHRTGAWVHIVLEHIVAVMETQ